MTLVKTPSQTKPKVLSLGNPNYADPDFLKEFQTKVDLHILQTGDRQTTVQAVADAVNKDGPFDAAMILMGSGAYERFDEELLGPLMPDCKIIACVNAGYSEFDLEYFTENRVYVTNTINAVAEPTADITIFLILAALRDTTKMEANVRQGGWRNTTVPPSDPRGLNLGIIGMGKIGKHVARKSKAFGMKVQYHNRHQISESEERELGVVYVPELNKLLADCDVISINCPLTESTCGMIGEEQINLMKDGVFLVNTGRGLVVDEKALIKALESGKIARAGLDVFDNEPKINPYFRACEKVIVQPHMGSWTKVAWRDAYHECINNVLGLFYHGKPVSPVNKF